MAQYAVLMYAPVRDVEEAPSAAELEPYDRHAEEMRRAGTMVAAFALEPATTATSLRGDVVTDGPFIETKEVVVGVYVIEAPHLDAALEIVRRNPILATAGASRCGPSPAAKCTHPLAHD